MVGIGEYGCERTVVRVCSTKQHVLMRTSSVSFLVNKISKKNVFGAPNKLFPHTSMDAGQIELPG